MRIPTLAALAAAALITLPAAATAQSLAEIAAQQKEKSKKKKTDKPAKVYTEEDLRRAGGNVAAPAAEGAVSTAPAGGAAAPGTAGAASGSTPPAGSGGADPSVVEGTERQESGPSDAERNWRERWEKANSEVSRIAADTAMIQQNFNEIGDNPYNPISLRLKEQLAEAQKRLAEARSIVEDLENERRKSGWRQ